MSLNKKSALKWVAALLLLLLIAGGVMRTLSQRKAQQQALAAAPKSEAAIELAATDIVKAQVLNVTQRLAVSGSLKAVNSAVLRARVAGELQGLIVREGDFVQAGQVIARIDASELQARVRQAREQADAAKSQVDVVQRQYDNNKALVDQGFISKTALDTSLANLNAARSNFKAAQAATDVALKSANDTVIKAPISGQVSQRLAQTGERVGVEARIVEIVDLSRLELEAALSTADLTQIQLGQRAELQIEGSSKTVNATVVRINPSAQAGSRSVLAYLSITSDASSTVALRQGLFAQGTLATSSARLLAVPLASVRLDKPAPYVQVIENSVVAHRTVELGARGMADGVEVVAVKALGVKGLEEGAVVLRPNVGSLREGTPTRFTRMGVIAGSPAATAAKTEP